MYDRLLLHRLPQFVVMRPHRAFRLPDSILSQRALRQLHSRQLLHDLRRSAYRNAVYVMQNVRQSLRTRPYAMRGRSLLPRSHFRVPAPDRFSASSALAYLDVINPYLRAQFSRYVGCRNDFMPCFAQRFAAIGAA